VGLELPMSRMDEFEDPEYHEWTAWKWTWAYSMKDVEAVLELTALRFQPLPATDLPVRGNSNHDEAGRFASEAKLAPDSGGAGGGEKSSDSGSMTSQEMADYIEANPESPEAKASKAWGIQQYGEINDHAESERSQAFLKMLRKIDPYSSKDPVWRGFSFDTAALRDSFVNDVKDRGYRVEAIARSFSKRREVALNEFADHPGFLMQIERHHGFRDFEPIAAKVAPQFAYQRELLGIQGQDFIYLGASMEGETPVLHLAEVAASL
jgi:hypothetical protein